MVTKILAIPIQKTKCVTNYKLTKYVRFSRNCVDGRENFQTIVRKTKLFADP